MIPERCWQTVSIVCGLRNCAGYAKDDSNPLQKGFFCAILFKCVSVRFP